MKDIYRDPNVENPKVDLFDPSDNQSLLDSKNPENYVFTDSECLTFISKLVRLFHWGPIIALFIILYIFTIAVHCAFCLSSPGSSWISTGYVIYLALQLYFVLSNYLAACFTGPGFVPLQWRPANKLDTEFLQFCTFCDGYKPFRSHHCRKCDRCVLKMDHHCPWINSCCGNNNHGYFLKFLFFAPLGCLNALIPIGLAVWSVINAVFFTPDEDEAVLGLVVTTVLEFMLTFFACGMCLGVALAVGILFFMQLRSVIRNETGIEAYIFSKAVHRREVLQEDLDNPYDNPYDLGWWDNLRQVVSFWGVPLGSGYDWPLRIGAHRFSMTIEQLKQKREKLLHSHTYTVFEEYGGGWWPLFTHGWRTALSCPLNDEPRLPLKRGEIVRVTRWRKQWLYGQLVRTMPGKLKKGERFRGWFPRSCVESRCLAKGRQHCWENGVDNSVDPSEDADLANKED